VHEFIDQLVHGVRTMLDGLTPAARPTLST